METKLNLIRLDVSTGIVELDVTKSDQGLEERLEGSLYKVKKDRMTDKKLRALCAEILGEKLPKNADPYIAYGIIDALKRDDYVDEPYTKEAIKAVVDQYLDALEFDNAIIGKEIEEEPTAIVYERIYRSKFRIRGRDLEKVVMPYMRDVRNRDVYSYRINCIDVRDPIEKAVDFIEGMGRSFKRRKRDAGYWETAEMIYEDGEFKPRNGKSEEEQETEPEAEKKKVVSEPEQTVPSQEGAGVECNNEKNKKQEEASIKPVKLKSKHDEYVEKKRQEDAERKVEKPSTKKQKEAKKEQIRKAVEEIDFDINL